MKSMITMVVFLFLTAVSVTAMAAGSPIPRPQPVQEIELACADLNCRIRPPDSTVRAGALNIGYDVYDMIPQPQKLRIK
jgi:hypothetical protein